MTPEKRAEKISSSWFYDIGGSIRHGAIENLKMKIADQIREAEQEAVEEVLASILNHNKLPVGPESSLYGLFQKGFCAAQDNVEALTEHCPHGCADRIRKMEASK